jgi:hypothetical protein
MQKERFFSGGEKMPNQLDDLIKEYNLHRFQLVTGDQVKVQMADRHLLVMHDIVNNQNPTEFSMSVFLRNRDTLTELVTTYQRYTDVSRVHGKPTGSLFERLASDTVLGAIENGDFRLFPDMGPGEIIVLQRFPVFHLDQGSVERRVTIFRTAGLNYKWQDVVNAARISPEYYAL